MCHPSCHTCVSPLPPGHVMVNGPSTPLPVKAKAALVEPNPPAVPMGERGWHGPGTATGVP